jgi:hypothetical protein
MFENDTDAGPIKTFITMIPFGPEAGAWLLDVISIVIELGAITLKRNEAVWPATFTEMSTLPAVSPAISVTVDPRPELSLPLPEISHWPGPGLTLSVTRSPTPIVVR